MIKSKIKIWQALTVLLVLVIAFRLFRIIDGFQLLYLHLRLFINDSNFAWYQLTLEHLDLYMALLFVIVFPVVIFLKRKIGILQNSANIKNVGLSILAVVFLFTSLLVTSNPDMQSNLKINSLKPPMHSVEQFSKIENPSDVIKNFRFYSGIFFSTYETDINKTCLAVKENPDSFILQFPETDEKIDKESGSEYIISERIFFLGTDELGRDIYSRLLYGTRFSILIGISAVIISFFVGTLIGFVSGYFESGWDALFNSVIDLFLAFPILFLIILLVSLFDNSILLIVLVLGLSGWMSLAKLVRGEVIEIKKYDFVTTSIQLGYSKFELLAKEFFPNLTGPVIVNLIFLFVNIVLVESALSFLGLGVQDIYPTWGGMIQQGQEYLQNAWWISLFPALALVTVLLYINYLGDQLKLKFDPKIEK